MKGLFFKRNVGGPRRPPLSPTRRAGPDLVCLYDVVMSADDKESSMLMGLEGRASFYIVKHVTHDDLKDLWHYGIMPLAQGRVNILLSGKLKVLKQHHHFRDYSSLVYVL